VAQKCLSRIVAVPLIILAEMVAAVYSAAHPDWVKDVDAVRKKLSSLRRKLIEGMGMERKPDKSTEPATSWWMYETVEGGYRGPPAGMVGLKQLRDVIVKHVNDRLLGRMPRDLYVELMKIDTLEASILNGDSNYINHPLRALFNAEQNTTDVAAQRRPSAPGAWLCAQVLLLAATGARCRPQAATRHWHQCHCITRKAAGRVRGSVLPDSGGRAMAHNTFIY
jgi:hypothetical protein